MRLLEPLGEMGSLAAVSLLTAVAVLVVVRLTSDQRALAAIKAQIHADTFEIRLFNDDPRAIARAVLGVIRHNATYLRLSVAPMLCVIVPLAIVLAQLQSFFGYAGIEPGASALVTAQFTGEVQTIELDAPDGLQVATPPISFPSLHQTVWKVLATSGGDYRLRFRTGGETYEKTFHVSSRVARRSPARGAAGLLTEVAYPSEPPLPKNASISALRIDYPARGIEIFGRPMHWLGAYTLLALAFAVILKRPLGVTI
jgi:hypothetical protein